MTGRIEQVWGAAARSRRGRRMRPALRSAIGLWCAVAAVQLLVASASAQTLSGAHDLFKSGHYEQVIADAQTAIDDGSYSEDWPLLKMQSELMTGRYADALETYRRAIVRNPSSVRLRYIGAEVHRYNNLIADAQRIYDEIEQRVKDAAVLYSQSSDQVTLGRFFLERNADARQVLEMIYDRAKEADPNYVDSYLATGELGLKKYDNGLAADSFRRAIELDPNNPDAHYGLALALVESDPNQATAEIEKALEFNPRHIDSLLLKVDKLIDAEFYDDARATLNEVLAINQRNPLAWAYEAVISHLEGDFDVEAVDRQRALDGWSTNPEVDHLIGRKLSEKYRFAEGEKYQRQALSLDPKYIPAQLQLSLDLLRLGQEEEGWQLANAVYDADGYNVQAHNLLSLHDAMAEFHTTEDDDFILRMDPLEATIYGERALDILHEAKRVLGAKYQVELTAPVIVEIFPNQSDFAVRTFGIPGGETGFLGVCFGNVITANSPASQGESPSNWEAVLWHEFCHVITLNKTHNRMPRWLSEGISVYEEKLRDPAWGQSMMPGYRRMILQGKLTPVSELSAAFLRPEDPIALQFAYYESALVVEYLVQEHGQEALLKILDDLSQGETINETLGKHIGDLAELDAGFAAFAQARADALAPDADWESVPAEAAADKAALESYVADHPKSLDGLMQLAGREFQEADFAGAEELLLRRTELYPTETAPTGALAALARLYKETGQVEKERAAWERIAQNESDAQDVFWELIDIAEPLEDWDAVLLNARRLLAVNPTLPAPHRTLAKAAKALGRHDEAAKAYRALLAFEPVDLAGAYYDLAEELDKSGRREEALRADLKAIEEAPRFRGALQLLSTLAQETSPDVAGNQTPAAALPEETSPQEGSQ